MPKTSPQSADDVVRIRQSTLIGLNRDAKKIPFNNGKISAQMNGSHLTLFKGLGMEFDEVRHYQSGDDLYAIDWKVTARTGEAHTKVFREERERPVLLWVDYRQPMFFATRVAYKSVIAAKAAALLAWSAAAHGDRIGGLIFSEQQHEEIRPLRGKAGVLHLIYKLSEHAAWENHQPEANNQDSAAEALLRLRRVARPGSLVFLISDFRHFNDLAQSYLATLAQHNDVVMISIHDPLEAQLPAGGYFRFSNGDSEIGINTRNQHTCQTYQQRFQQQQDEMKQLSRRLGLHFMSISTDGDLLTGLQSGLGLKR